MNNLNIENSIILFAAYITQTLRLYMYTFKINIFCLIFQIIKEIG